MSRLITVLSIAVLAACSSKPSTGSGTQGSGSAATPAGSGSSVAAAPPPAAAKPTPHSVLEQIQQWAPQGSKVAPAELQVPGIELFAVGDPGTPADEHGMGKLVGVSGGVGGPILEGRDLLK